VGYVDILWRALCNYVGNSGRDAVGVAHVPSVFATEVHITASSLNFFACLMHLRWLDQTTLVRIT
jgi:hypothetical protein